MIIRYFIQLLLIFLCTAPMVQGDDLGDVQNSFETTIRAFNTGNRDAFISSSHTDVVVYGALSAEATRGKEAFQQLIRDFVATHGAIHFTPVNPAFRVAWGNPLHTRQSRLPRSRHLGARLGPLYPAQHRPNRRPRKLQWPLYLHLYQNGHRLEARCPLLLSA